MHHTCCSHFPSRKDHLQTPLNSSHTTAILKQKEKKNPSNSPGKKSSEGIPDFSLSLRRRKKFEKNSHPLSVGSHINSPIFLLRISSLSDRTVGFFPASANPAPEQGGGGLRTRAPTSCTPPPSATKHGMDDKRVGTGGIHTYIRLYTYIQLHAYILLHTYNTLTYVP